MKASEKESVSALNPDPTWKERVTVPRPILVGFSRHLSAMLAGGVPLTRCLECLTRQDEAPNFGLVIYEVAGSVSVGGSLSDSLRPFRRVFPPLYVDMIKTGEASGQMTEALERLATWLERDERVFQKIKQALTYPSLVLVASFLMTLSLFYFVVPKFLGIVVKMGGPIPLPTQVVLTFSNLTRSPGAWILGLNALGGAYYLISRSWATPMGRLRIFQLLLAVPLLGDMLRYASLARFCSAAEMALSNGLTLIASLELAAQASYNPVIINDSKNLRESLSQGTSLSKHLFDFSERYDRLLIDLVATGEESAKLDIMLRRGAEHYDDQVSYLVDTFGSAIEPILLVGVGTLVALILLSVFLPMYSVITTL